MRAAALSVLVALTAAAGADTSKLEKEAVAVQPRAALRGAAPAAVGHRVPRSALLLLGSVSGPQHVR